MRDLSSASKNKILHVLHSLDFGGVETRMKAFSTGANRSYVHSFCAIARGGSVSNELVTNGSPVHILNLKASRPSISAVCSLMQVIRSEAPTIVHCHGAEANFHGLIAAKLCGVRACIGEEIGIPRHSRKARLVFKGVYGMADGVVAISQAVKDEIVRLVEAPAAKISRIYNPVIPQPLLEK